MADEDRPPLIVIMADQLRHDVLGAYGGRIAVTPQLDRLAGVGSTFLSHFTNCPLCVPAKTSFVTARDAHEHGAIIHGSRPAEVRFGMLRPEIPTLPTRLADEGYDVVHVGVQHVRSHPPFEARDERVRFIEPFAPANYYRELFTSRKLYAGDPHALHEPIVEHEAGRPIVNRAFGAQHEIFPLREDLHFDRVVAAKANEQIDDHARRRLAGEKTRPLALLVMFWLPHGPLRPPQRWLECIDRDALKLPPTVGRWDADKPALQLQNVPGQLGAHVPTDRWPDVWAAYLALVAMLDDAVGSILQTLDRRGVLDDAAVLFTADHGEMLGCHAMFQKSWLYEEAVRLPLIFKLPGQRSPRRIQGLSSVIDLAPTLLALARRGAATDEKAVAFGATGSPQSARSLLPLARGARPEDWRDAVFASYDGAAGRGFAHRMVRTDTHKLILNQGDIPELYDLVDDPRETRNRAQKPDLAEVRRSLEQRLLSWTAECGDPFPQTPGD